MKRRTFLRTSSAAGLLTLITRTGITQTIPGTHLSETILKNSEADLETSFVTPPDSAKPYTWWHWINGNVTNQGITLDLEAMKCIGLGGFQQFDVGKFAPVGPATYGSPLYWELKRHAIREADRLGLNFEMHNCPGWSSSGGPWITPELSMQVVTWSELQVEAGRLIDAALPQPTAKENYYRDIFVLAFPETATPRLAQWRRKANFPDRDKDEPATSQGVPINSAAVLNITECIDHSGRVRWTAPPGRWTILRLGVTTTGMINRTAVEGGIGLECDKLRKDVLEFHLDKILSNLRSTLRPMALKGRVGLLIDSYEVGMQNWTPAFPEEFRKRRGYDLVSYLPTLTGRVVDSATTSEQFLWDFRRTQADLMADNYYGHFTELCHQHGITTYAEPYGTSNFEELQAGGRVDRPMGEFWLGADNSRSVKLAASVGHVFAKQVIGAESFTGFTAYSKWQEYPFNMKATGDWMFTQGINRFYFHRFAHQPHPTAQPGMTMGPWGLHFDRTNTWFEQSKTWMDYLARCQFLLQQGRFVADLLYYGGSEGAVETPILPADLSPTPPEGYQWDVVNDEVSLNRMKIEGGLIVLPDGMKYRLLILPANTEVTLAVLSRLQELVKQGLTLVGARPKGSPSLSDQKRSDEFSRIASELWWELREDSISPRRFGSGQVFWTQSLGPILDQLGVKTDFACTSRSGDAPINFIHRRLPGADLYFIANRRRRREEIVVTMRIPDQQPELWDAATGKIKPAVVYELCDGGVRLPLVLEPAGSVFVVFRAKAAKKRFYQISKNDNPLISTTNFPIPPAGRYREVYDNYTISVWAKPETDVRLPADLEHPKQYFSYIIYPPAGEKLYGSGHVACGLTAGRNGVLILERGIGIPRAVLKVERPLAGRTHIAVVYERGAPALFLDGELIQRGGPSGKTVHPGLGEALQSDNAYYFNGDMTEPQLFTEALSPDRIRALVARGLTSPEPPMDLEQLGSEGEWLFWQNGRYAFRDQTGRTTTIDVAGIDEVLNLKGPWQVSFPPNLGAPTQVTFSELFSLHRHPNPGVKYFSGTATYRKEFVLSTPLFTSSKRLFVDLGRVEVLAEVRVNERPLGSLWKEPYRLEITEAVKVGQNNLEIAVTNLWPNRLIGDEQLPAENDYYPGRGYGGDFPAGLKRFPDWYLSGRPKPPGGRFTFSSWKHYDKDSPLLESGLLGPVVLRSAVGRRVG